MKVAHLETFAKVASTGSFTRAAHDLFTTQPTVTNHIQLLEQELGCQLFKRSKKHVRLTEQGKNIYHKVEEIFRLIESIKNINLDTSNEVSGVLNIAASSVMGANYLPPVLRGILHEHPNINVQLRFGNSHSIASWVDEDFVDLGFAPESSGFPRLSFKPLLVEPCILVTGADSHAYYRDLFASGECKCSDFIIREKGTKLHEVSIQWLKKQPFYTDFQSPHILWNIESIKNLILEGTGIAILPKCSVQRYLDYAFLKEIPCEHGVGSITYCLIERQNSSGSAITNMLKHALVPA